MMHMTLYWSTKATILFTWWNTESWLSYALTLLVILLLAVFFQYMEDLRLRLFAMGVKTQPQPSIVVPLLPRSGIRVAKLSRFGVAVLVGVNSAIAYLLMLAVMSYNGGVLVSVVLGFGVGFYLFRGRDFEGLVVEDACGCS